ncbi:hypothetical protein ACFC06_15005 [Nocardia sp. NPDC056064]|uniref:hypothetical protein n=1 Tax=Nocardia sp. NPDC056064 TaxID=3345701 RepID=UPI0035DF7963
MRLLFAAALVAVFGSVSGCGSPVAGAQIAVQEENPDLAAAFARLLDEQGTAELGDIIASAGVPIGEWDQMFSVRSPISDESVNKKLGTQGVRLTGLNTSSDSLVQVFLNEGKVVYAYKDEFPRYSVAQGHAEPDSLVSPKSHVVKDLGGERTAWYLEIEGIR